ncbi:MAG: HlyD family efflux transporter periplasmic adaptor subunit [Phycisphaerae bacterium]|nr:HlyD family efflux transporter periplasmic adaptor subunit [Phycisphaerae bacterium]
MKKWIAVVVVIVGLVLSWWYVSNYVRYTASWNQPKFGTISRGDISVPISASGLIEPKQRIDVKSEASGEVLAVNVREGDFVHAGDVLVSIKQEDEKRSVARAQEDLTRVQAALEQAKLAEIDAGQRVISAEASVADAQASLDVAEFEMEFKEGLEARGDTNPREMVSARATLNRALAGVKSAEASLEMARLATRTSAENIKIQEANLEVSKRNLADAEERLAETTVVAPQDALVTDVNVTAGTIIQSASSTFTGGTTLLELADISQLKVITRVDEADYGRVLAISPETALPRMGDLLEAEAATAEELAMRSGEVQIKVDAFPDLVFSGLIERVEPQGKLNPGSSIIQFDVHVVITDEKRSRLLLGTQAQVEFTVDTARDALRVPADAVKSAGDQRGIYLRVPPEPGSNEQWGKKFVPVTFGITDGTYTQVVRSETDDELKEGQQVYTKLPTKPREDEN